MSDKIVAEIKNTFFIVVGFMVIWQNNTPTTK
jgi:hypothetical protein